MAPENISVARLDTIVTGPYIAGSLRPLREASLRAQRMARVVTTYVDAGDRVTTDQLLARLDTAELRATERSARRAVRTAEQTVEFARTNVRRAETLFRAGGIALRDVESARLNLETAESQLADATARLATIEEELAETEIRAPFSGRIADRQVSEGDLVQPGSVLFVLTDQSSMRLEAELPAEHLDEVRVGTPATFVVRGYPGTLFRGRVDRISPAADSTTRQIELVVSIPDSEGVLVANLFADGEVESIVRRGVVIPQAAIFETDLGPAVMVIRQGRAELVEVVIGVQSDRAELVLLDSGVCAGDTVLVGTAASVTAGTPIAVGPPTRARR